MFKPMFGYFKNRIIKNVHLAKSNSPAIEISMPDYILHVTTICDSLTTKPIPFPQNDPNSMEVLTSSPTTVRATARVAPTNSQSKPRLLDLWNQHRGVLLIRFVRFLPAPGFICLFLQQRHTADARQQQGHKHRRDQRHPLPALQHWQGNDHHTHPQHNFTKVVGVTRARPQPRLDELALVLAVGVEAALLQVCSHFHRKPKYPHQRTDHGKGIQRLAGLGGDDNQRRSQRERHPQRLDGPHVQEAHKVGLDLIKAIILAGFLHPAEEEGSQAGCPGDHQRPHQHRPGVYARAEDQRQRDDGDVGQAAGQVKVFLGLLQKRRDEHQPLDDEDQPDHQGKDGDVLHLASALAAGCCNEHADQDQQWKNEQ